MTTTASSTAGIFVARMEVGSAFATLSTKQKLYAHHLARAAWHGARIILEQVSPEANGIFDFILEVHRSINGNWNELALQVGVPQKEISAFLDYAATFLSNLGNFYGKGDQKFTPVITTETLHRIGTVSKEAHRLKEMVADAMMSAGPSSLGYPSDEARSQYYPGEGERMTEKQVAVISKVMETKQIWTENTRLTHAASSMAEGPRTIEILQASVEIDEEPELVVEEIEIEPQTQYKVCLKRGDFADALSKICEELNQASEFTEDGKQKDIIKHYVRSFQTGNLESYRESQRLWVTDISPKVENILGFVEQYRDPAGSRAEFEGIVAIEDAEEGRILRKLVARADHYIQKLPWARGQKVNNGKGPFEKSLFEPPSFASLHTLAYCSTVLFDGINLPNHNDIRQNHGSKNVVIANRLAVASAVDDWSPFVDDDIREGLAKYSTHLGFMNLVAHELLGHGTGQMMAEELENQYNFDTKSPPVNPLTAERIQSWYLPGETWNGQFGNIAGSVEECRAELVGAFLVADPEFQDLFRSQDSFLSSEDLLYLFYCRLGAIALSDLKHYIPSAKRWGQAHARAHFAMFRCLQEAHQDCVQVIHEPENTRIKVRVDRDLVMSVGRKALEEMLLRLHMYKVTADVQNCREYYETLSCVNDVHLAWRDTVVEQKTPRLIYVQANTTCNNQQVSLIQYEQTREGILQSWADRNI